MKVFKDKNYLILALILVLALTLRASRSLIDTHVDKDAVVYVSMAKEMSKGNMDAAFDYMPRLPPLYVFLMSLGERIGIGAEKAGLLISIMASALLVIPVFWISHKLSDDIRVALIAAFLTATHPYLVRDGTEVLRDSLYYLLAFTGLAFAVSSSEKIIPMRWSYAGLFSGLASLTRSEGNELLIATALWACWELRMEFRKKSLNYSTFKKYAMALLCLVAGFMAATVPVQTYLSNTTSTWGLIDHRIFSYGKGFATLSKTEIIKAEEH